MNRSILCVAISAGLAAAPATAQQVGGGGPAPDASVALDQLSATRGARAAEAGAGVEVDALEQNAPSMAAKVTSAEISTRADGRTLASSPVGGADRCDSVAKSLRRGVCRRPLESRAGDYTRPRAAPVTAEGRLLLLTNAGTNPTASDPSGGAMGASGFNAANGPAEQLAGALQDRAASQDNALTNPNSDPTGSGTLPPGVPTIVVVPPR